MDREGQLDAPVVIASSEGRGLAGRGGALPRREFRRSAGQALRPSDARGGDRPRGRGRAQISPARAEEQRQGALPCVVEQNRVEAARSVGRLLVFGAIFLEPGVS